MKLGESGITDLLFIAIIDQHITLRSYQIGLCLLRRMAGQATAPHISSYDG